MPHYHPDRSISLEIPADPNDMVLPAILQEWWEFPNPCAILLSPPYRSAEFDLSGDLTYTVRVLVQAGR